MFGEESDSLLRKDRLTEKMVIDFLQINSNSSAIEIAFALNAYIHKVESILRDLEIKQKVKVKLYKTSGIKYERKCLYSVVDADNTQTTPAKENQPNYPKPGHSIKYPAPYIDRFGNIYKSIEDIQIENNCSKASVFQKLRIGTIGCNGKKPADMALPPYVDHLGNTYNTKEQALEALQISMNSFLQQVKYGTIGSNGKPPKRESLNQKRKRKEKKKDNTKKKKESKKESKSNVKTQQRYHPPFVDEELNEYATLEEAAIALGCNKRTVRLRLAKGTLGTRGMPPANRKQKAMQKYFPPFFDAEGNQYDSIQEIINARKTSQRNIYWELKKGLISSS